MTLEADSARSGRRCGTPGTELLGTDPGGWRDDAPPFQRDGREVEAAVRIVAEVTAHHAAVLGNHEIRLQAIEKHE